MLQRIRAPQNYESQGWMIEENVLHSVHWPLYKITTFLENVCLPGGKGVRECSIAVTWNSKTLRVPKYIKNPLLYKYKHQIFHQTLMVEFQLHRLPSTFT